MKFLRSLLFTTCFTGTVSAFDASADDNVVIYWGQNSAGGANTQERLSYYCQDDSVDVIIVSFLTTFFATGGLPSVNFGNACEGTYFDGTGLLKCDTIGEDIKTCQSKGKKILLSLGGAAGSYGFSSSSQAVEFAQTCWDLFGAGSSSTRPFGDSVVDGFDLDIEGGSSLYYADFVTALRGHYSEDASRTYYVAAAPQCPEPDAYLDDALTNSDIDFIFVQFYNNYCGMQAYGTNNFNFDAWDTFAKSTAYNKNSKVYLGVPASTSAAGTGYVPVDTVISAAKSLQSQYSSFGGVMMWDASQAWNNNDFAGTIKKAISGSSSGGSGESPVASSSNVVAPASSSSAAAISSNSPSSAPVPATTSSTSTSSPYSSSAAVWSWNPESSSVAIFTTSPEWAPSSSSVVWWPEESSTLSSSQFSDRNYEQDYATVSLSTVSAPSSITGSSSSDSITTSVSSDESSLAATSSANSQSSNASSTIDTSTTSSDESTTTVWQTSTIFITITRSTFTSTITSSRSAANSTIVSSTGSPADTSTLSTSISETTSTYSESVQSISTDIFTSLEVSTPYANTSVASETETFTSPSTSTWLPIITSEGTTFNSEVSSVATIFSSGTSGDFTISGESQTSSSVDSTPLSTHMNAISYTSSLIHVEESASQIDTTTAETTTTSLAIGTTTTDGSIITTPIVESSSGETIESATVGTAQGSTETLTLTTSVVETSSAKPITSGSEESLEVGSLEQVFTVTSEDSFESVSSDGFTSSLVSVTTPSSTATSLLATPENAQPTPASSGIPDEESFHIATSDAKSTSIEYSSSEEILDESDGQSSTVSFSSAATQATEIAASPSASTSSSDSATAVVTEETIVGFSSSGSTWVPFEGVKTVTIPASNASATNSPSQTVSESNDASTTEAPATTSSSLDGTDCENEGDMVCDGTGFATCNFGKWIVRSCGPGTVCHSESGLLYCGYPLEKRNIFSPRVSKRDLEVLKADVVIESVEGNKFRGVVKASAQSLSPIGSEWRLDFQIPNGKVTSVSEGVLSSSDSTYSITSNSSEVASRMALVVNINGEYS